MTKELGKRSWEDRTPQEDYEDEDELTSAEEDEEEKDEFELKQKTSDDKDFMNINNDFDLGDDNEATGVIQSPILGSPAYKRPHLLTTYSNGSISNSFTLHVRPSMC